jgi:MFS family permease
MNFSAKGPLTNPGFRRLWIAGFISELGDWMFMVSIPVFVYLLTDSVSATATNFMLELLPAIVLSPMSGLLADRWDRRRLMVGLMLVQIAALLPLFTVDGPEDLIVINIVTAVQSALVSVFQPAKHSLMPNLVTRDDIPAANGLISLNGNLARLIGGSIGGIVLAGSGLTGVLLVDIVSFLLAVTLLLRPFGVHREPPVRQPVWRAWLEGLREITTRGELRSVVLPVGLMGLAQGLFAVLFVVFVTDRLGGGESEVGLLRGVQAIGGMLGGAVVGTLARRFAPGRLLGYSLLVFAAWTAGTWNSAYFTTSIAWFVGLFAVAGAPGVAAFVGRMSVVQLHTEDATRGRVLASMQSVFDGFQLFGMLVAGTLVAWVGLPATLNVQAGMLALAGLLALLWHGRSKDTAATRGEPVEAEAAGSAASSGTAGTAGTADTAKTTGAAQTTCAAQTTGAAQTAGTPETVDSGHTGDPAGGRSPAAR